jgi:2,3-bisphosphoglycerate-independent phosphoglycerate mutase
MMKLLFVVLDGLGDLPSPELGGKTPLESAETPHMDSLAKRGKTGLMHPTRRGIAPESDTALMSILGYDPYTYHTGRRPLEAFGAGLTVNDGDLALRCNFATIRGKDEIVDRRAGRDLKTSEAARLARAVNKKVRLTSAPADFVFKNTVGYLGDSPIVDP